MRGLVALLLLAVLATGCASSLAALEKFPERTQEALSDPVRRVHLATQFSRMSTAASVGIACTVFLAPTLVGMFLCPLVAVLGDYLAYEYVLEPLSVDRVERGEPSLVAPYWETGPRSDEGEFFVCGEKPSSTCRPEGSLER